MVNIGIRILGMSNATVDQNPKGQGTRPSMQNGLEQKNPAVRDEFDSSYMHPTNVNQPYGMAQTTDSFMPSYYGQMAFPYMGTTEWSSGTDSMPYMAGYSGDTQQHNFLPDAMFGQPGPTPTYYNQAYNYFPANNEFSAWTTPSTGPGGSIPDNTVTGYGQQNAAVPATPYNGDYYSVMPASPHDYLGGNDMLPATNGNLIGPSNPPAIPVMSGGDVSAKLPGTGAANGIKMVEQGIQNLGLGVTSIAADPSKQQMQQNVTMPLPGVSVGVSTGTSQNVILPGPSMPVPMGQNAASNNGTGASVPGSNAPKPVSWAAIASKPAKPQPKSKAKAASVQALPPPIRHNMDIGTWDNSLPPANKGPVRGTMPEQQNVPQRWSAPRQGGNGQRYGVAGDDQRSNNQGPPSNQSAENTGQGIPAHLLSADEIGSAVLNKLKSENDYNPKRLTLDVRNARFFVIKSYSEDDIHRSIKYNIWCSTEHGNKRLDAAFREQQGRGPVILFYSVNGSGHFCGVAEMLTAIDYSKRAGVWAQDKWKGKFQVKWIYAKDVPNSLLRHIRLENNENKPVTNSRDTQEVPPEKGRQVLKIISSYKHQTSIFDDFLHYERRQVEEEGQRAKRNNQPRPRDYGKRGEHQSSPGADQIRS